MLRLKELRKQHNLNQTELAAKLGITQVALSGWENEKYEIDNVGLIKCADVFNCSVDYLLGRVDYNIEPNALSRNVVKIPVLGRIPAGIPIEAIEDILDYIEIAEDKTDGGKQFFSLKIKGDSMYPEYKDGDIIILEKSETCENGDDCAVLINGDDATFKRVERKENGIVIKPLNPAYETLFFSNSEIISKPVRILGIVRELRREK